MREMKDSGIEWIGEIPVGWEIIKLKMAYVSSNAGEVIDKSFWNSGNELLYTCQKTPMMSNFMDFPFNKRTTDDDLLLTRNATPYIFIPEGNAIYSNVVQRITISSKYERGFVRYALQCGIEALTVQGDTIPSYNMQVWNNVYIPNIPRPQQHRISTYLDTKCEKIDSIIARQQEVIEKLKTYKLSVITEAVTKGLNPDVRMKDSGVEWIGDVPEHWGTTTISKVANMYNGDRSSNYPSGTDIVDEGIIFVTSNNLGAIKLDTDITTNKFITKEKYDSLRGAKLQVNDIIFCLRGSVGKCAINYQFEAGTIASSLVCIRPVLINPSYLNFMLHTPMIVEQAKLGAIGIGSQNLAAEDIGKVIIAIPAKDEQQQIADYLDKKCSAIDSAIAKKQAIIEKLTAYKKSLIYEVVTGKREV